MAFPLESARHREGIPRRPPPWLRSTRLSRVPAHQTIKHEFLWYGVAVLSYIAISWWTKALLTWTWGPTYFVLVLEALPRGYRRLRRTLAAKSRPAEVNP